MLRPAVNKLTSEVELINIETHPNIDDYIIVWINKEANQNSMSINGDDVYTQNNNSKRQSIIDSEALKEEKIIELSIAKNKSNNKK